MKQLLLLIALMTAGMAAGAQTAEQKAKPVLIKYQKYQNGITPTNFQFKYLTKMSSRQMAAFRKFKYEYLEKEMAKDLESAKEKLDLAKELKEYDSGETLYNMHLKEYNKFKSSVDFFRWKKLEAEQEQLTASSTNFICYMATYQFYLVNPDSGVRNAYEAETFLSKDFKIIEVTSIIDFPKY